MVIRRFDVDNFNKSCQILCITSFRYSWLTFEDVNNNKDKINETRIFECDNFCIVDNDMC